MNVALILAAGNGSRVGADIPKQFVEVLNKPVLAYTLDNFQTDLQIDAIEIVCQEEWIYEVRRICDKYQFSKVRWITTGGSTFQKSVLNGVLNLKPHLSATDNVVICSGVSPFCASDIINDSILVANKHGNAISAEDSPLCTCIKDDEEGTTKNLIRETIKGFSFPWTFRFEELLKAYEKAVQLGILDELEPHTTSLYLALGIRLWFSKSSGYNFKITLREDLDKFEGLLLLKEKRQSENKRVDY